MTRRRTLKWGAVCIVAAAVVWASITFLAPHAVKGPAKRVDASEQKELLKKAKAGLRTDVYPQLAPKVVEPTSLPETNDSVRDRLASVAGRIVAQDTGAGIADALVRVILPTAQEPAESSEVPAELSAKSDADGRYRISGIPASDGVLLLAAAERYCPAHLDIRSLPPGAALEDADITLMPAASRIAGHVFSQRRSPIPGAMIEVIAGYEEVGQVALSNEAGAFGIALPADGAVVLMVSKEGYGKERFTDIHPGMEQLELILMQGGAIEGKVTDEHKKPQQGLNVVVSAEPSDSAGKGGEALWNFNTRTDQNGDYRVDDLSSNPGYTVRVTLAPRRDLPPDDSEDVGGLAAFVRSQRGQERALEEMVHSRLPNSGLARQTGVRVSPGQATRVDLEVRDAETKTALIYGHVTDPTTGRPACPIQLQAFWHESVAGQTFLASTTTDINGSYELFMPTVNQRERIWITVGWDNTKPAASVDVDPEVPKELNLTLPAPVTAVVQCVDEAGKPLPGLKVGISGTTTDSTGSATVFGLAPYVTHTLSAFEQEPHSSHFVRLGVSPPFTGKPGETVSGLRIWCVSSFGVLTGQLVVPQEAEEYLTEGRHNYLPVHLYYEDGGVSPMEATMDADYRFRMDRVGPGRCAIYAFLATSRNATSLQWWTVIESVDIVPGEVTDLGLIPLNVSEAP